MGEKREYTSTSQIDSREPKKKVIKMTGISISNFPYYFNFFLFNQLLLYSYSENAKCGILFSHE